MVYLHSINITINIKCFYAFSSPNNLYIRSSLLFVLRPHLSLSLLFRFQQQVGRNVASYRSPIPTYRNLVMCCTHCRSYCPQGQYRTSEKHQSEPRFFGWFLGIGGHWGDDSKTKRKAVKTPFYFYKIEEGFIYHTGNNNKNKKGF